MNTDLFFANAGDERGTPTDLFRVQHAKYQFTIDLCANAKNAKLPRYFGDGGLAYDALKESWVGETAWMNPPYSACAAFVKKAFASTREPGTTVVGLLPVRTDTKWWHSWVWDREIGLPRAGVTVDFLPGRLTFELHVGDEMRAIIRDFEGNLDMKEIIELTGLPQMAIKGIWDDKPDDALLSSAPFPSCLVEWRV